MSGGRAAKRPRRRRTALQDQQWADVFKMFSRRQLLVRIQPVDRQFNAICNDDAVDTVHIIKHLSRYFEDIEQALPEAMSLISHEGNDLAEHFRLHGYAAFKLSPEYSLEPNVKKAFERREDAQASFMEHCAALFEGFSVEFYFGQGQRSRKQVESVLMPYYLAHLGLTWVHSVLVPDRQLLLFINHLPMVRDCSKLYYMGLNGGNSDEMAINWLHRRPAEDDDDFAVKVLVIRMPPHESKLVELCKQKFDDADSGNDRCCYFLTTTSKMFDPHMPIKPFTRKNSRTGERLVLLANGDLYRCSASMDEKQLLSRIDKEQLRENTLTRYPLDGEEELEQYGEDMDKMPKLVFC